MSLQIEMAAGITHVEMEADRFRLLKLCDGSFLISKHK